MRGRIFILIGPSGVGKTTLATMAQQEGLADRVVTCTTRSPRPTETDGRDYYFFSLDEFSVRNDRGEFVENEWIHGNRYGVLVHELSHALESGRTAVISLGYQGAERVKQLWPDAVTIVGVLPPSWESLKHRLKDRGTDESEMAVRLRAIDGEAHIVQKLADTVVVNDQLPEAYQALKALLLNQTFPRTVQDREV